MNFLIESRIKISWVVSLKNYFLLILKMTRVTLGLFYRRYLLDLAFLIFFCFLVKLN